MHVGTARHDRFGTRNHNAVGTALGNVHVAINVLLIARALAAVTFTVSHRHAQRQILVLNAVQVSKETLVLLSPIIFGHLPSGLINRIERIVREVPLSTTTLPAEQPNGLEFGQQILTVPVDV